MRSLLPIWGLLFWLTHTVVGESISLDKKSFDFLASKGLWFVEHFSPYCGHCVAFAPTWKEFTEEEDGLATTHDIHFGAIDCSIQGDLCKEHEISGFPMIKLYQNGQYVETFSGVRSKERMKTFLLEQHAALSTPLSKPDDDDAGIVDETAATTDRDDKEYDSIVNGNRVTSDSHNKPNPHGQSVDMDSDALQQAQTQDRPYFIKFYAPWCPHCQHLEPIWQQMARELKNQVDVGEVDCDKHKDLCAENQINGYPTLKLFDQGQVHLYSGDRSLHSLLEFATKMTSPSIKTVNEAELKKDLDPNGVAFIYLHKDKSDDAEPLLQKLGKRFINGMTFYQSTDQKLVRLYELGLTDLPVAMIVKDGHHFLYPGQKFDADNMEALAKWIQLEKYPVVSQLTPLNAEELLQGQRVVVLGVFSGQDEKARQQFRKLAEKGTDRDRRSKTKEGTSKERAIYAQLDMDTYGEGARSAYNIQRANLPAVVIVDGKNKQYFNRDAKLNLLDLEQSQTVLQTLDEAVAGKLKGISTLSLPAQLGQHLQQGYHQARSHSYLSLGIVLLLGVAVYKIMAHKRKQSRTSLLPSAGHHLD